MSVNKIISTVNSISSDSTVIPDINKCVTIDTSNNRLGINTLNPKCAIDVSNNIHLIASNYDDISANTRISSLELEGYLLRLKPIPINISINDISNHLVDCIFARKNSQADLSKLYFMTSQTSSASPPVTTYRCYLINEEYNIDSASTIGNVDIVSNIVDNISTI
tara:strand:+ start:2850 stop:3344 length:495 start_codon:yes stop_codon:yes gene_type:complete